jgi:hypothetical protein
MNWSLGGGMNPSRLDVEIFDSFNNFYFQERKP